MNNMGHLDHLEAIAAIDVANVREKERTYRGSWKRRGGVGAFMMLARKWDRLEGMLGIVDGTQYNIFAAIEAKPSGCDGSTLAEVRDLRRYLLLVEAEMVSRGVVKIEQPPAPRTEPQPTVPRTDSNKHGTVPLLYVVDGLPISDYIAAGLHYLPVPDCERMAVIDRRVHPDLDQLPRLFLEQNHKEWSDLPREYRWMYRWYEEKYLLRSEFREFWGRGP